ncbi:hypothetical protein QYC27_07310 [Thermosynechococcus sp. PP45]|nr:MULTISPECIES: hypothetical protein [unclassified Thermosynechococcus]WKT80106.1 hypothetical protein QYC27_07310 [Thermosynechococcus sp. PP45]WNC23716.1 hypothetical protein RHH26_07305 [Thermosynechococcus sp. PP551]WNC26292.1 hypothetical protein RHH27_07300 [Thermosynechococcus sp. PP555]
MLQYGQDVLQFLPAATVPSAAAWTLFASAITFFTSAFAAPRTCAELLI